jgi:hypothetical protein
METMEQQLIVLADGNLLHTENKSRKEHQNLKILDFNDIPVLIKNVLDPKIEIKKENCHMFSTGTSNNIKFKEHISGTWLVHEFEKRSIESFCPYSKMFNSNANTAIAWALGVTAAPEKKCDSIQIVVVSNSIGILLPLSMCQQRGVSVWAVWPGHMSIEFDSLALAEKIPVLNIQPMPEKRFSGNVFAAKFSQGE